MRNTITVLAGVSALALATSASAQVAAEPAAAAQDANETSDGSDGEIIVTARRRAESLQDVPQTINAVTSEQFEKLNLLDISDIDKVVSGLQIVGTDVSMRGVTFNPNSAAAVPTTATYVNDAPTLPPILFQVGFDIGQIEVLRGPQGTLRGISSPSGAITFTTKRPDLTETGGTVSVTATDQGQRNLQAAVNLPLVTDVLAVRAAYLFDDNEGNGVRSINVDRKPYEHNRAARISLRFEPNSSISANIMYQRLEKKTLGYGSAIAGNGSPGGVNVNAPTGYNGPVIDAADRRAVVRYGARGRQQIDLVTGQLEWAFAGQRLSYVGSWQRYQTLPTSSIGDPGNILLGYPVNGTLFNSDDRVDTHELRLSSDERIAGIFDYVVGAFYLKDHVETAGSQGVQFLPGAFGNPNGVARPGVPNLRYSLDVLLATPRTIREVSFFGNVTAHITDRLELSGGLRHINSKIDSNLTVRTTAGFAAVAVPPIFAANPAAFCALPVVNGSLSPVYANTCDVAVPAALALNSGQNAKSTPWIWDLSLSYKLSDDFLVYGHAGSSWREGIVGIGLSSPATGPGNLAPYLSLTPEKSKSYEAGFKWTFLDGRGRLNVSYYHQDYSGLIYGVPGGSIYYLGASNRVAQNPFFANVPAKVDGIDVEASFRIAPWWTAGGNVSWARGRVNAELPCNDGNFDGVPDATIPTAAGFQAAGVNVATCDISGGSSTAPKWNLRLQSELTTPVFGGREGFLTGLFNYQPKNPNVSPTFVVPSYALLDVFVGLRDPERRWELSIFGKNLTNTRKVIDRSASFINPPGGSRATFGDTGYRTVTLTPRREFGINLRYAFGSR